MNSASDWVLMLNRLDTVVLLAAGFSGLLLFRRLPAGLRHLAVITWLELLITAISYMLWVRHRPNLFLIPIDAVVNVWLLSLVYAWGLQWPCYSRWRPWLMGLFVLGAALSSYLITDSAHFSPALMVSESLILLPLPALYFRKLLNELHVHNLVLDAMFWVSVGVLLYFLGKLLIGLFSNYLLAHYSKELNIWVWTVHAFLLLVLHSCYLRALWLRPQK